MASEQLPTTSTPEFLRSLWRGAFPEALSLLLTATLVASLAVATWLACSATLDERRTNFEHVARLSTQRLAAIASSSWTLDEPARNAALAAACGRESVELVRWTRADGTVVWSWPAAPESPDVRSTVPDAAMVAYREAVDAGLDGLAGTLEATFRRLPDSGVIAGVVGQYVILSLATLTVFLLTYWRIRACQRPVVAVERSLTCFAENPGEQIGALVLSATLGPTAEAWNKLIGEMSELRRECERAGRATGGESTVQRFESRALREVLDCLPVGVVRIGRDQRISYANAAAARFLSRSTAELVGYELDSVMNPEAAAPLTAALIRGGGSVSIQRALTVGDNEITLRYRIYPPPQGAPDGAAVLAIEDVSHIQEAERARDNFLYHVTHELRTPLTNIHAYAETLAKPDFADENIRRECYNVIISETRRLSQLVEDILSISQLEVGSARVELADLDLVRLLRQIAQDNLGHADEKNIELSLRIPAKAPPVRGDKGRMAVLLNNLIGNAIKYTPENGRVDVVMEPDGDALVITVADTGIGISPEDQKHVFEKFYRSQDETVQSIPGTGLGLSISREIARLHGGDIKLNSVFGKGSRFVLELPVSNVGAQTGVHA